MSESYYGRTIQLVERPTHGGFFFVFVDDVMLIRPSGGDCKREKRTESATALIRWLASGIPC